MVLPELVHAAAQLAALVPLHLPGLAPTLPPVGAGIPDPAPVQPPGTGGISTLLGWLKWIGFAIVGGAIIIGGILIAVSLRRGEGHDALPKVLWPLAGAIVIGAGIGMVSALVST